MSKISTAAQYADDLTAIVNKYGKTISFDDRIKLMQMAVKALKQSIKTKKLLTKVVGKIQVKRFEESLN